MADRRVAVAATLACIAVCIVVVDPPLATFIQQQLYGTTAFSVAAAMVRPLPWLGLALVVLVLLQLVLVARGAALPGWTRAIPPAALAAAVALAIAVLLKHIIGRSQVYPVFLVHHTAGLRPFSLANDYAAFPSAAMAATTALLLALGDGPVRRAAWAVVILVALAILVTNSHWLSDIIAGIALGVLVTRAMRKPSPVTP